MNIKNFSTMLLKEIENSGLPVTEIKRLQTDKGLFGIAASDNSQFLLKIAKHNTMNESTLLELDETEDKIHEIYETFTNSWEYSEILMNETFNIDWLLDILDDEDYWKLENYILHYCSRNDELLFRLKYTWSLFIECAKQEKNKK